MAEIIDIRTCDDPRDVIHRVVERLAAGELVGIPTESSYVAAAQSTQPEAVARLASLFEGTPVLAVKSVDEALDYTGPIDFHGERLLRRIWPGPVVITVPISTGTSLVDALPEKVRAAVVRDGQIRLRMPDHMVFVEIQRLTASPLVISGDGPAGIIGSPSQLVDRTGGDVRIIVEDGPPLQPGRSTTVRLDDKGWTIVEDGLLDEKAIRERTNFGALFICTGNTCRSPLAEAIFRKMLAERLECGEDELLERGFFIASAGLSASYGMPAAAESLALGEEFGLDLARHRSRPLTDELLDRADYVFTMTGAHRESILSVRPDLAGRVHLLSREGIDIADPIGGGRADYENCRAEIERELLVLLEHLPLDLGSKRN